MNPTYYIGLDVHKNFTQACVMDEKGDVLLETRFPSTPDGVDCLVEKLPLGVFKTVVEASSCVYPLVDALRKRDFTVYLAHPLAVKWITSSVKKTDRVDARKLADLLRLNVLPEAYAPTPEIRMSRSLGRERIQLTRVRTMLRNQIHRRREFVGATGKVRLASRKGRDTLKETSDNYINRRIRLIESIQDSTQELNVEIHEAFNSNRNAQLLTTIPGVGEYSAVLITAEIGDVKRFNSPKKLCAYAGLVPTIRQTGETTRLGSTRRQGNHNLKWALTQCTHIAVRYDPHLRKFYQRIKKRVGVKKAVTATARKMFTIMYWMLYNQQEYVKHRDPGVRLGYN